VRRGLSYEAGHRKLFLCVNIVERERQKNKNIFCDYLYLRLYRLAIVGEKPFVATSV
jgi:hypothetical protein